METCSARPWKPTTCFALEYTDWETHICGHKISVLSDMWLQIHTTSLNLSQRMWSSAWCSLTTMLASHVAAYRTRLIPLTLPARKARPYTPSHLQPTVRTASRQGIPGKSRSMWLTRKFAVTMINDDKRMFDNSHVCLSPTAEPPFLTDCILCVCTCCRHACVCQHIITISPEHDSNRPEELNFFFNLTPINTKQDALTWLLNNYFIVYTEHLNNYFYANVRVQKGVRS